MMKNRIFASFALFILVAVCCLGAGQVFAGDTSTAGVQLYISEINEISVSTIDALSITTATAGSQPDAASDGFSYSVTSNQTSRIITSQFDQALPHDVTITINLTAPPGTGSSSEREFTETNWGAQTLVYGVGPVAESDIGATITFAATVQAGVLPTTNRTLTLTITGQ